MLTIALVEGPAYSTLRLSALYR